MLRYAEIEDRADYILHHNGADLQVFCLEDNQGAKGLFTLDGPRNPRTGERKARLVAEVFADDSVEWH